jgi:chromosome segregation ATPase
VKLLSAIPALLLAVLLGQGRAPSRATRARPDAGEDRPVLLGTDPPGRLRPTAPAAADAGTAQRDAGPDEVHRELQALRARLDVLEQELARSRQTSQQLEQLTSEVQQLRQQVADGEAQRQAAQQQREAQRDSVQSAVSALYAAQQRLMGGNASIETELEQAQAAFSGQAQRDIQAARNALQNHDLVGARALLSAAISNAQAGR